MNKREINKRTILGKTNLDKTNNILSITIILKTTSLT